MMKKEEDFLKDNEPVKDTLEIRERELKKQLAAMAEKAQSSVDEVMLQAEEELNEKSMALKEQYNEKMEQMKKEQDMRRREREEMERKSIEELYYRIYVIGIIMAIFMSSIACIGTYVYNDHNRDIMVERQIALEDSTKALVEEMKLPVGDFYSNHKNFYQEAGVNLDKAAIDSQGIENLASTMEKQLQDKGWQQGEKPKGVSTAYLVMDKGDREIILSSHEVKNKKQYFLSQVYMDYPEVKAPYAVMHYMYTTPLEEESSFLYGLMTLGLVAALGAWVASRMTLTKDRFTARYAIANNRILYIGAVIAFLVNGGLYLLL